MFQDSSSRRAVDIITWKETAVSIVKHRQYGSIKAIWIKDCVNRAGMCRSSRGRSRCVSMAIMQKTISIQSKACKRPTDFSFISLGQNLHIYASLHAAYSARQCTRTNSWIQPCVLPKICSGRPHCFRRHYYGKSHWVSIDWNGKLSDDHGELQHGT